MGGLKARTTTCDIIYEETPAQVTEGAVGPLYNSRSASSRKASGTEPWGPSVTDA
jgi:hypothetical protein